MAGPIDEYWRTLDRSELAWRLEEHAIPWLSWADQKDVPEEIQKVIDEDREFTAIGRTEHTGWFILDNVGQGPGIEWIEKDNP